MHPLTLGLFFVPIVMTTSFQHLVQHRNYLTSKNITFFVAAIAGKLITLMRRTISEIESSLDDEQKGMQLRRMLEKGVFGYVSTHSFSQTWVARVTLPSGLHLPSEIIFRMMSLPSV
jgi:hypothetical protein